MYDRKLPTFVCDAIINEVPARSVFKLEIFEGDYFVSLLSDRASRIYSFKLFEALVHKEGNGSYLVRLDPDVYISNNYLGDLYVFFSEHIKN